MKAIMDLEKKLPGHHLQVLLPPPLFLKLFIFTQREQLAKWDSLQDKRCQSGFNCLMLSLMLTKM